MTETGDDTKSLASEAFFFQFLRIPPTANSTDQRVYDNAHSIIFHSLLHSIIYPSRRPKAPQSIPSITRSWSEPINGRVRGVFVN